MHCTLLLNRCCWRWHAAVESSRRRLGTQKQVRQIFLCILPLDTTEGREEEERRFLVEERKRSVFSSLCILFV